ncbi:MAG TPA: HAD-IA family hydrolase [Hyphomicrobiales bacterium]|nr:HAD-IA family hydrolase [Rhodobiaceae bacterium]HXK54777.1 HAD-IA family hydrolase [Hyphomicrobiales bacterium]
MYLVIFDCDGTLVDSQHMIVAAMESAFAARGHEAPAREQILSVVGLSLEPAIRKLVPDSLAGEAARLADAYRDAFTDLRSDPALAEPLYPGARAVLDALAGRDDALLGIATGKSVRGVRRFLEREGLEKHFITIQTADTHPSKPHPSMVAEAMAQTGIGPESTVMVGDTTYDVEMARAARAGAVGVRWGYHAPDALLKAGAEHVLDEFSGLMPHLAARWGSWTDRR